MLAIKFRLPPGGGLGDGGLESQLFFPAAAGISKIDFQGDEIESITLWLRALTLEIPGKDPNKDGIWTDFQISATIFVNLS